MSGALEEGLRDKGMREGPGLPGTPPCDPWAGVPGELAPPSEGQAEGTPGGAEPSIRPSTPGDCSHAGEGGRGVNLNAGWRKLDHNE